MIFLLGKIIALDGCGFPLHSLEVRLDIQALVSFRAQIQADPFNKGWVNIDRQIFLMGYAWQWYWGLAYATYATFRTW